MLLPNIRLPNARAFKLRPYAGFPRSSLLLRKTANSTTPIIKPITTSLIKTDNLVSIAPKSKIAMMTGIAWLSLITALNGSEKSWWR